MTRNDWTTEKLFFRLINNKSDKTYWDNITALRKRPTIEVFDRSIELTNSLDARIRTIGINVLAQLGSASRPFRAETVVRFFELLQSETDPETLRVLLVSIGHNNERLTKEQIANLCEFGASPHGLVREGLVFSLLRIRNPKAIDTLILLSSDKSSYIRDWATFGIGSLNDSNNKKIRAALWVRVDDEHLDTRCEAIVGLARRKDIRVREIIKRELQDGEYGTWLFEAILEFGDKQYLPTLRRTFKTSSKDSSVEERWLKSLKECINDLSKKV
jgi:HEAT repeat protein